MKWPWIWCCARVVALLILVSVVFAEKLPRDPESLSALAARTLRQGEIGAAREMFAAALEIDARHAGALVGLGRIQRMEFQQRQAQQNLARAYQINPNNPHIVREYAVTASGTLEAVLMQRLSNLKGTSAMDRAFAAERIAFQRLSAEHELNRLVSPYARYELRMGRARSLDGRSTGWILKVSLNGHRPLRLLFDTGSRGLLISKRAAKPLNLDFLTATSVGGFGEGRNSEAMLLLSRQVTINGALEFQNVAVEVSEQCFVDGIDGLIGPGLFREFLITMKGPRNLMELAPNGGSDEGTSADFQPMRRLDHLLLVEDRSSGEPQQLVIDTGASYSVMHDAIPSLTGESIQLIGVSGTTNVTRANLPFRFSLAGLPCWTRETMVADLSAISDHFGVKISAFLGFPVLLNLEMSLDLRRGLIRVRRP